MLQFPFLSGVPSNLLVSPLEGYLGQPKMRKANRRAWSLSAHLLVLCLAILVPGIILGGLALWNMFAAERASTELRLQKAVEDVSDSVDREILGYTRVGETLAASPLLQSRNFSLFDLQARQMLSQQGWFVIITDRGGQEIVNTSLPAGASLPKVDTDRFQTVMNTGKPRVSDLFYTTRTIPLVGVRIPVIWGGETAYILTIAVPPEVFTPLLAQSVDNLSWSLEIADRTGRVIARSDAHAANVGRMLPESAMSQLKWRAIIQRGVSYDNGKAVRVVDRAASGWIVTALIPGSELAKIARRGWTTFAGLAIALTALSILLAYIFARRIAQPIQLLANIPLEGRSDGFPETTLAEANRVGAALIRSIRELEAGEERYRTLVEAANDIIYTTDREGRFLTCNAAGYKSLGYSGGELIGRPLSSLVADGEEYPVRELVSATDSDQRTREIQMVARSGKLLIWEVSSRLMRDTKGEPETILSIARDITDRKRAEEGLRANEERLRLALAGIGAGVWEYDLTRRSSMWSPEMMELYGMSGRPGPPNREELLSLIHPDDRERIRVDADQMIRRGGPFAAEFRVCRPDGSLVWINSRGVVELGPDGRAVRARGIDQDVTAVRNAALQREQLLRTTAQQLNELQSLYNSATIGLALLDRELRFQRINKVLAEMIGGPGAELIGKRAWDLMPACQSAMEPLLRAVLAKGEPATSVEISAETPAQPGVVRTWLQQFYPLKSSDDAVIGIGVICEEVTERRRALLGQAHLAAIVETSSDAIVSYSMDGRIRSWNPGAERMFGYSAAEAIDQDAGLLVPPDSREPPRGFFERVKAGDSLTVETLRRKKDGTDIPVSLSASPMRDNSGRIVAISGIFRDISEQRMREEHTRFIMRELSHRSKNLLAVIQAMARQTARTSRSLDDFQQRFTARVKGLSQSHDLLVKTEWHGVPVGELVRTHVAPFVDRVEQVLVLSGPDLLLKPEAAQNIGLALHELATNASKHGALSSPTGRIEIQWRLEQRDGERRFKMTWRESGGPPVSEPKQRGFGHSVVEAMVGRALEGEARLEWRPEGLVWRLDASSSCMATENDRASAAQLLPRGMAHELQALSRVWLTLRNKSDGLPRLEDLDIESMPGAECMFIVAVDAGSCPVQFRYLRIGEKLAEIFGRPDRGEPLHNGGDQVLGSLDACHRHMRATGQPCHDWARFSLEEGRPLVCERLMLPFFENGKDVTSIVVMAVYSKTG